MVRGLMSDEEWAFFEPFVIERGPRRGRRPRDHRLVLDGVFWIARTGSAWRDLHDHFGKWSSVYRQSRRWTLSGVWDVMLAALNDSGAGQDSVQMIDSTIVRAHQHSAGAQKKRQALKAKVLGGHCQTKRRWPLFSRVVRRSAAFLECPAAASPSVFFGRVMAVAQKPGRRRGEACLPKFGLTTPTQRLNPRPWWPTQSRIAHGAGRSSLTPLLVPELP